MKHRVLLNILLVAVLLSVAATLGAVESIDLTDHSPIFRTNPDSIPTGQVVTFTYNWNNDGTLTIDGWTCGFRFYLEGAGTRSAVSIDLDHYTTTARDLAGQDGGQFVNEFSVDGVGADTLGLGAFKMFKSGMLPGFNEPMALFSVTVNNDAHASQFCIDTCWYPPSNNFLWSYTDGGLTPAWSGPHCFTCIDEVQGVNEPDPGTLPDRFALHQNYPNPFNMQTAIRFDIKERTHVTLEIYNVLGQKMKTLVDEVLERRTYEKVWDGSTDQGSVASTGVYFYKLVAEDFAQTKKMLLLK